MKKLLLFMLLFSTLSQGQITLKQGTAGYVVVNGQSYERRYLMSQYNYTDSTLCILYANTRTRLTQPFSKTSILNGDASSAAFPSMDSVKNWMNANFEPIASTATSTATSALQSAGNSSLTTIATNTGLAATAAAQTTAQTTLSTIATNTTIGTNIYRVVASAGTNKNLVAAGVRTLRHVSVLNAAVASVRYIKVYDAASAIAVTVGTTIPKLTIAVPVIAVAVPGVEFDIPFGMTFSAGIVIAITGGLLDTDATSISANDVILQMFYN